MTETDLQGGKILKAVAKKKITCNICTRKEDSLDKSTLFVGKIYILKLE